jgi:O-antigen ligase
MLLLGFLALGLAFLMPGHYVPWVTFEQQLVAAIGGLAIGGAALRRPEETPTRPSPLALMALALSVVPLVQLAFGQILFRSDGVLSSVYLLSFSFCAFAAQRLAGDIANRQVLIVGLCWTLLAAALASTAIALVQWQQLKWSIFLVDMPPGGRPYGNLAQPNHLATLIALGAIALLYLYERGRFSAAGAALPAAFLAWGLAMTQSRTGWLFVLLLVFWWAWKRRALALRSSAPALAWPLAFFVLAVWAWGPLNNLLLLTAPLDFEARLQAGTRWIHWPTLWDAALREPLAGYGWGQVVLAQQAAALDHPAVGEWLLQSHNFVLDLMIYNGVVLGLLVVGFVGWWLMRHIRRCRTVEQWALIAAIGTLFTHALLEYPLDYLYFLLPAGLIAGTLDSWTVDGSSRWRIPRWSLMGLWTMLFGMLLWVSVEYIKVESAVRQLRFVMLGIGVDKVPDAPVPDVWLLDQPREFHRYWMTPATTGMSVVQLDWMRRVSMREPRPPAQLRYALAAGLNGRPEEAAVTLARLCKLHAAVRCDEGRASWIAAQQQHPVLRNIPYPATPPELR